MFSIEYRAYLLHYRRVAAATNFNAPSVVAIMPPHTQMTSADATISQGVLASAMGKGCRPFLRPRQPIFMVVW